MVHENHRGLGPPLPRRQDPAFNVAAVAAMLEDAEENVVVTLADRDNFGPEEGVVAGREKEERLLDLVKDRSHFRLR